MTVALAMGMFVALLVLLMLGYPVAFTLSGVSLFFGLVGASMGVFHLTDFGFVPLRLFGIMANSTLVAIPLFVVMGLILDKSGLAKDLLQLFARLLHRLPASLALAVIIVGALLGATTGIVGATVVTLGLLALPEMEKQGYDHRTSLGTVAASGTLGQIIPPSIVLIVLGDTMQVDVGDLFIGAILPSLLLVSFYLVYTLWVGRKLKTVVLDALPWKSFFFVLLPPLSLVMIVLGSILFGIASPTEAAACGAVGAYLMSAFKTRLRLSELLDIGKTTARISAMIFMILIGAQFFGVVFRGLHGEAALAWVAESFSSQPSVLMIAILIAVFILGCFLDFLEICFIVVPIITPLLIKLGVDRLWFAVVLGLILQTSFLTPPFGFSLFYLKGVAPKNMSTQSLYLGVIPFIIIQLIVVIVVYCIPAIATFLPRWSF